MTSRKKLHPYSRVHQISRKQHWWSPWIISWVWRRCKKSIAYS